MKTSGGEIKTRPFNFDAARLRGKKQVLRGDIETLSGLILVNRFS